MLGVKQIARRDTEVGPACGLERTRFGLFVKSGDADENVFLPAPEYRFSALAAGLMLQNHAIHAMRAGEAL